MEQAYPVLQRIREVLETKPNLTLRSLGALIDRSERWFYHLEGLDKVAFGDIVKLSRELEFNFFADYANFMKSNQGDTRFLLTDSENSHKKPEQAMNIAINVRAPFQVFSSSFPNLLLTIKREADKYGFEII